MSYKDLKAVAAALKPICKAVNEQAAAAALDPLKSNGQEISICCSLVAYELDRAYSLLPVPRRAA